jgi:hypothetical protein
MPFVYPDLGWVMLPTFCDCLPEASKDFRRSAVWDMLILLLKKEGWLAAVRTSMYSAHFR